MPSSPYVERLIALGFDSEDSPELQGMVSLIQRMFGREELMVRKFPLHFVLHPNGGLTMAIDGSGKLWFSDKHIDLSADGFTLVDLSQLIQ